MGLLLGMAALWVPSFILRRELEGVALRTTAALDDLLNTCAPRALPQVRLEDTPPAGSLAQRRAAMARAHNRRVAALVAALGREEAVRRGRAVLFPLGLQLGQEVRSRLGVGGSAGDLLRAARVLYRVLGIHFTIQWSRGDRQGLLFVHRCALAEHYSDLTCAVLSATDEGAVRGLNPRAGMVFRDHIPGGAPKCRAHLEFTLEG
jgi:hypothetical protein